MADILPPWKGTAEILLAQAAVARALPVPVDGLWDPARCPSSVLPWLAWALAVEDWDPAWPEWRKREVIAQSIALHRMRGTVAAVRRVLELTGFGSAKVIERWGEKARDGSLTRDGEETRGAADHWAEYRVILDRPISAAQAVMVRALIERAAPARCHLKLLDFTEAPILRDGTVLRDGTYTRGGA
ncbi:phage tail protein I [Roseinatronobacter sp. NSM]|uniref:phage tail protein I n=1 Tax=Roseinatronobacter sp. NSM TaxID=3457785 RepID=UPI00403655DE